VRGVPAAHLPLLSSFEPLSLCQRRYPLRALVSAQTPCR
jgi:hypothetical protein